MNNWPTYFRKSHLGKISSCSVKQTWITLGTGDAYESQWLLYWITVPFYSLTDWIHHHWNLLPTTGFLSCSFNKSSFYWCVLRTFFDSSEPLRNRYFTWDTFLNSRSGEYMRLGSIRLFDPECSLYSISIARSSALRWADNTHQMPVEYDQRERNLWGSYSTHSVVLVMFLLSFLRKYFLCLFHCLM